MRKPVLKVITMLGALAALALGGGLAPASGQTTKAKAGKNKTHHRAKARHHSGKVKAKRVRRAAVSGTDTTTEPNGAAEPNGASEPAGTEQESASDGPGGHEDNPNDPNADHQFEGQE
jgi:uncharacterized membrane protein